MQLLLALAALLVSQNMAHAHLVPQSTNSATLLERAVGPPAHPNQQNDVAEEIKSVRTDNSDARARQTAVYNAQNRDGISARVPNPKLPDPCGPPNQPLGTPDSRSTCHANVSVADTTSQQSYGVHCLHDNTTRPLDQGTCSDSIRTICGQISGWWGPQYQTTNKWIWSTQNGNCAFGYWLPEKGAPPPSFDRCLDQILTPMNEKCVGPEYNAGSVNLRKLPEANSEKVLGTGMPVDGMYPSYVMVSQPSYFGVNSEDGSAKTLW